jgi:hypothetical protein
MPTFTATPHARRFRPLLFVVAAVLVMLAIGTGVTTGASDPPCKDVVAKAAGAAKASPAQAADDDGTPLGLDLELRVWKLRIEFPWLKSLPVRPGRHIVISVFEAPAATN